MQAREVEFATIKVICIILINIKINFRQNLMGLV